MCIRRAKPHKASWVGDNHRRLVHHLRPKASCGEPCRHLPCPPLPINALGRFFLRPPRGRGWSPNPAREPPTKSGHLREITQKFLHQNPHLGPRSRWGVRPWTNPPTPPPPPGSSELKRILAREARATNNHNKWLNGGSCTTNISL